METCFRMWLYAILLLRMSCTIITLTEANLISENQFRTKTPIRRSHVNINRYFGAEEPMLLKRRKPVRAQQAQRRMQNSQVYELDDKDSIVVEANDTMFNEIPDAMFSFNPADSKKKLEAVCVSNKSDGLCLSKDVCHKRGGTVGNLCKREKSSHCCTFVYTCGDSSSERVSYFRSPPNTSSKSQGSLACDYDILIRKDTCAVRVEYTHVNLARKLGGVCDIDQIYILNSVDGPTTGQCGPLSGYATTVAVKPKQDKPLKIALLIQNDVTFNWDIKVTQLSCNDVYKFKVPHPCGVTVKESTQSQNRFTPTFTRYSFSFQSEPDGKPNNDVWWSYPEPIFNMYYYSSTKKHLLQERLGQPSSKIDNADRRIVGGIETGIQEFPWQVAIALDDMFFCGGALINDNFVLTAAHCVLTRDTPIDNLMLHVGDHNLMMTNETKHLTRKVQKIFFHSHFHPFLLDNDIALLQLDKPVTFADNIQPICLPEPSETYTNKKATVVGWGITSYPMGTPSSILQKIQVEVVSNFHCSRIIEESIGPGMICAAPPALQGTCFEVLNDGEHFYLHHNFEAADRCEEGRGENCHSYSGFNERESTRRIYCMHDRRLGDSGGPLSVETDSGKHVLIGIVSYGLTGCALVPAYPDIYTRVSEYIKWIEVNAM